MLFTTPDWSPNACVGLISRPPADASAIWPLSLCRKGRPKRPHSRTARLPFRVSLHSLIYSSIHCTHSRVARLARNVGGLPAHHQANFFHLDCLPSTKR